VDAFQKLFSRRDPTALVESVNLEQLV